MQIPPNSTSRKLKSLAHHLTATLRVGKQGVTASLCTEVKKELKKEKMLKIKVLPTSIHPRKEAASLLESGVPCRIVSVVGSIITVTNGSRNEE
jgi:RNA-binding protein